MDFFLSRPLTMNNLLQTITVLITGGIIGGITTYLLLKKYMITAENVRSLIDALNAALLAEANDAAALAQAQQTIATASQNDAALNDPTLQASLATALANASAANPPGPAPAPVSTPPSSPPTSTGGMTTENTSGLITPTSS
jgi:hypothetical protein